MTDTVRRLTDIYNELEKKYNFYCPSSIKIVISSRLRKSNGVCWIYQNPMRFKIVMSKALLDEFGWDIFEKTFRHEVAHVANCILHNSSKHDMNFKVLCRDFGGTMNPKMAGHAFADCASTDYVKTIKKWSYTCKCGHVKNIARRMSWAKRTYKSHVCPKCRGWVCKWEEKRIDYSK